MSKEEAQKPGVETSEWKATLAAYAVNLILAVFGSVLSAWGVEVDTEVLVGAILANVLGAGSYSLSRAKVRASTIEQ